MNNISMTNQKAQARYLFMLVFAFFLAMPLLWLFFSSEIKEIKLDNQITLKLTKIRQYNAELSKYILRSRSNIDNNFDAISVAQKRLQASAIDTNSSLIQEHSLATLSQAANNLLNEKDIYAEKFKSLHAKVNNSLRYLPVLEMKIQQQISSLKIHNHPTNSILINSFNFRLFNDDSFLDDITSELNTLDLMGQELDESDQQLIASFISHSKLLLTLRQEETQTIQALLSNNLDQQVSLLEEKLSIIKKSEANSTQNLKMYLLLYSAVLFLLTLIFLGNRHHLITSMLVHKNLSEKDQLTGLNNRRSFLNILEVSLNNLNESDQYGAALFIDLDGFKAINDNLGHNCGDKVLQILSERFMEYIDRQVIQGAEINAARLGGDEFVFLIDQLERDDLSQEINKLAQELLKMCSAPLDHEFSAFPLSASIGVAIYPEHGNNVADILNAADKAMYQSKLLGKNRFTLYQSSMRQN